MKIHEFSFDLPSELIAETPAEHRDDARLMVIHKKTGLIEHKLFKDIVDYLNPGDVVVGNNTKVFPARLYGQKEKTGAKIEVFLLRELNKDSHLWDVNVDPARKIRVGNKLYFGDSELVAEVIDNTTSRGRTIRFLFNGTSAEFLNIVDQIGETPLPRSILDMRELNEDKEQLANLDDRERYQTIFAKNIGAVQAPAAGLHFTKHVLKRLELKDVEMAYLTSHVGLKTFLPLDVDDLGKYKPDAELFNVPADCAEIVNRAIVAKKRVVAVGASTMRAMESAITANNQLKDFTNWTDKFLYQPYEFKLANALVTNMPLPHTPPQIMACAFGGLQLMMKAYREAVEAKYRFYVYGDAMLILA